MNIYNKSWTFLLLNTKTRVTIQLAMLSSARVFSLFFELFLMSSIFIFVIFSTLQHLNITSSHCGTPSRVWLFTACSARRPQEGARLGASRMAEGDPGTSYKDRWTNSKPVSWYWKCHKVWRRLINFFLVHSAVRQSCVIAQHFSIWAG